jgi:ribosomal protein L35AE/L33A
MSSRGKKAWSVTRAMRTTAGKLLGLDVEFTNPTTGKINKGRIRGIFARKAAVETRSGVRRNIDWHKIYS